MELILNKELELNKVIQEETRIYQFDLHIKYFEYFNNNNFVINQQNNIIKMTWNSCWRDTMLIIIEWENTDDAKMIYFYPKYLDDNNSIEIKKSTRLI
jgi:hypothetical protein